MVEVTEGGQLLIDGSEVTTPYLVREAVVAAGLVVVLYDPDADPRSWGTFRNLAALSADGHQVWLAETSTTYTGDCWEGLVSSEPLVAVSWQGYRCEFDPATGRILERTFIH